MRTRDLELFIGCMLVLGIRVGKTLVPSFGTKYVRPGRFSRMKMCFLINIFVAPDTFEFSSIGVLVNLTIAHTLT
jgi:hypothetical protein